MERLLRDEKVSRVDNDGEFLRAVMKRSTLFNFELRVRDDGSGRQC